MRRWFTLLAIGGSLLIGTQGICRETVRRPVVRFIDFYVAAEEAQKPPSFLERIAYGLAIAIGEKPAS